MDVKQFLSKIKELATWAVELETENAEASAEQPVEEVAAPEVEAEVEAPEVEAVAEVEVEAPAEAEVEVVAEAEAPVVEYATKDELNELRGLLEDAKSLFSKQIAEKEEKVVELQKQLDEKPDAEAIKPTPNVELNKTPRVYSMEDLSIFK